MRIVGAFGLDTFNVANCSTSLMICLDDNYDSSVCLGYVFCNFAEKGCLVMGNGRERVLWCSLLGQRFKNLGVGCYQIHIID